MKTKFIVLALIIFAGSFLRLSNLGKFGFWWDEYFHVFAAKSYMTAGTLTVPSDGIEPQREYTRALPVTALTILSFKLLGESEFSARLPFALANIAFLIVGYAIISRAMSPFTALAFTFIMAFAPFAIEMSRECRMYTLLQLFYFLMTFAFIWGLEDKNWKLLAVSALFAALSMSVQVMTLNFGFVVIVYAAIMAIWKREKKYIAVTAAVCVGGIAIAMFGREFVEKLAKFALNAPDWSRGHGWQYYRYIFTENYPMLCAVFPLGAWLTIRIYGRKGLFLVLSFIVPFFLHTFVYAAKTDRYIFYVFPFFVLAVAQGLDYVREKVWGGTRTERLALACVLLGFCLPWLPIALKVRNTPKFPNWKPGQYEARVKEGFKIFKLANDYYYGGTK